MNIENCSEFSVGFCPFSEFNEEGLTIKCPFVHSNEERETYSNSLSSYPNIEKPFKKFKEIIDDVEKKIVINNKIIQQEKIDSKLYKALQECQKEIEMCKIKDFDCNKLYGLLSLHGKLILYWNSQNNDLNLDVCNNCSAIKSKNLQCEHKFCLKYKYLREITMKLTEILQGNKI